MLCPKCGHDFDTRFCPSCGYSPETETQPQTQSPAPAAQASAKPRKKHGCLVAILVVGLLILLFILIGSFSGGSSGATTSGSSVSAAPAPAAPASEASAAQPKTEAFEVQLSAGYYTAGVDIPSGKYDITAVSGSGNVSSSNMMKGGINAMMGDAESNKTLGSSLYQQEYLNIKLPDDTVLSVNGDLVVKIASEAASTAPLTPRKQSITEVVELGNGNFIAGEDFPAGVYDIAAVSGGGNVSSNNLMDGGINAILGDAEAISQLGGFYTPDYKNVSLPQGTELKISRVKVSLTPSK